MERLLDDKIKIKNKRIKIPNKTISLINYCMERWTTHFQTINKIHNPLDPTHDPKTRS